MAQIKRANLGEHKSFSAKFLAERDDTPQVSAIMAKGVSEVRRVILADETEQGYFRDGSGNSRISSKYAPTSAGLVSASSRQAPSSIERFAQSMGGPGLFGGRGNTVKQAPEVYSPLWLNSNLNLPRDRATINAWCRSFFALNPFVHNAISLHSTYPISKMSIKCPNKDIEKFFNDMIEEIDLMNVCIQIAQEFWLLGEAFIYAELDEGKGKWSRLHIQNPDFMIVKRTVVASEPIIMLRPDQNLKDIIFSNRPNDVEQRKQLPRVIVDSVRRGQSIPLDNFNVSHLARRISPYEIRGTGLPVCIFRQLMLFDRLRESKYAQADNMINPMTLVKIGSADYKPTWNDIEAFRDQFEQCQYDKDFKLFTHDGVTVERVGYGQGIYDISGDITQLVKEIFIGLQVPQVMMDGGADTTYANGGVALDLLKQRYMYFRNMMSSWLKNKIFAPISKIQGFYDYSGGEKQLIVPEIDWNHMALFDAETTLIPWSLCRTESEIKARFYIPFTVRWGWNLSTNTQTPPGSQSKRHFQKELASLEAMELNALRALDVGDEIPEAQPAPGQAGTCRCFSRPWRGCWRLSTRSGTAWRASIIATAFHVASLSLTSCQITAFVPISPHSF